MSYLVRFVALVLLTTSFSNVQSIRKEDVDNCNSFKTGHPCRCVEGNKPRRLICDAFESVQSLVSALDVVRGQAFSTIIISDGSLIPYPEGLFKGIKALCLTLERINLDHTFHLDRETDLGNRLETLELLSVNGLQSVDWGRAFGGIWDLYQMIVENSPLPALPMTASAVGAHGVFLNTFELTNSNVSCLDDLSMSTFSEVRYLDLSDNQLSTVRRAALPVCKREVKNGEPCLKLEVLNLSNNKINQLPDNLFDNFEMLEKVFLAGNRLTTLDQGIVTDLPNHVSSLLLDLYDNPMVCDCKSLGWILKKTDTIRIYGSCEKYPDNSLTDALRILEKC